MPSKAAASGGLLSPVLDYTDESIVSSDIVCSQASGILDSHLTFVIGNLVKVLGWYDNEWGTSAA